MLTVEVTNHVRHEEILPLVSRYLRYVGRLLAINSTKMHLSTANITRLSEEVDLLKHFFLVCQLLLSSGLDAAVMHIL